jgi:hypothetical protein
METRHQTQRHVYFSQGGVPGRAQRGGGAEGGEETPAAKVRQVMKTRWAWFALAVLGVLLAMVTMIVLIASPAPWLDDAVFVFAALAPLVVGAVLVLRQPDNTVGKVLVLIGAAWSVGESARIYLWLNLHLDLPLTDVPAWLMHWVSAPAWALIPVLLVVFPTGAVASSWLRWPLRIYVALLGLLMAASMVAPGDLSAYGEYLANFTNPLVIDALRPVYGVTPVVDLLSGVAVFGFGLTGVGALVFRWRRSSGTERLQMRAFALGAMVMVLLLVVSSLVVAARIENKILENLTTTVAISTPPVAIGVAVLRYRLYEIDRLISRTVSYALVVAVLAGVFALVVIGLPAILNLPDDSSLLVAGATLAVAALFNPLRRRLQSVVDRRFNRGRYDAEQEVSQFAERLRDQVDLDEVTVEMMGVLTRTIQPASAAVWIRDR